MQEFSFKYSTFGFSGFLYKIISTLIIFAFIFVIISIDSFYSQSNIAFIILIACFIFRITRDTYLRKFGKTGKIILDQKNNIINFKFGSNNFEFIQPNFNLSLKQNSVLKIKKLYFNTNKNILNNKALVIHGIKDNDDLFEAYNMLFLFQQTKIKIKI